MTGPGGVRRRSGLWHRGVDKSRAWISIDSPQYSNASLPGSGRPRRPQNECSPRCTTHFLRAVRFSLSTRSVDHGIPRGEIAGLEDRRATVGWCHNSCLFRHVMAGSRVAPWLA
jgi:hypothetical protein